MWEKARKLPSGTSVQPQWQESLCTSVKGSWGAAILTGIPSCPRCPGTLSLAPHRHCRMNDTALALLEPPLCARHQAELLPHFISLKLTVSCSVGVTITVYRWGNRGCGRWCALSHGTQRGQDFTLSV